MLFSVPTSPRSVAVDTSDVTSVSLSWRPPHPTNGIITGYSIGHYKSRHGLSQPASDLDKTVTMVAQPSLLRYNVTGLLPYTTYQLQVIILYGTVQYVIKC